MLRSEDHTGSVLFACFSVVLRPIAVHTCLEIAELASEDTTIFLTIMILKIVVDARSAANLAFATSSVF